MHAPTQQVDTSGKFTRQSHHYAVGSYIAESLGKVQVNSDAYGFLCMQRSYVWNMSEVKEERPSGRCPRADTSAHDMLKSDLKREGEGGRERKGER